MQLGQQGTNAEDIQYNTSQKVVRQPHLQTQPMSISCLTRSSALVGLGGPEHPEAVLEPGESTRQNERKRNIKSHLEAALSSLKALTPSDVNDFGSDLQALLQNLQQQCQSHLGQSPQASNPAQGGEQSVGMLDSFSPSSPGTINSASPALSLAQIARGHDVHGRFSQADHVDAFIFRLAQTQMQNLADQGLQGAESVETGLADEAKGIWGISQTLSPINWGAAAGSNAVSGVHNWFSGQVDTAVEQRIRAMGLDPNKQYTGATAPAGTPSAASPTTPAGTTPPATATTPSGTPSSSVASPTATTPADGSAGENTQLVERYLGWAFYGISQKRLPSAAVRADLAAHLAQSQQSPAFTALVLQQFDSRIGNQQAVKRQDAELAAGR